MRLDLHAFRKGRLLKVSEAGVWQSVDEIVAAYNLRYEQPRLTKHFKKLCMHPARMKRLLNYMVRDGYYLYDENRGYCLLTKMPKGKAA